MHAPTHRTTAPTRLAARLLAAGRRGRPRRDDRRLGIVGRQRRARGAGGLGLAGAGRVHVHAEGHDRLPGAGDGRGALPQPGHRLRPAVLPHQGRERRGRAGRARRGAASAVAREAVRLRLRHAPGRREAAQPDPAHPRARRRRGRLHHDRLDAGQLEPVPQRGSHPVRTRRQALRDRGRRAHGVQRPGPHAQPARQDPAHEPRRLGARHEPDDRRRSLAHLRLRHPQLLRVRVRPRERQPVGDRERPRVQRRDQPRAAGRQLRLGCRARAAPTRTRAGRRRGGCRR